MDILFQQVCLLDNYYDILYEKEKKKRHAIIGHNFGALS